MTVGLVLDDGAKHYTKLTLVSRQYQSVYITELSHRISGWVYHGPPIKGFVRGNVRETDECACRIRPDVSVHNMAHAHVHERPAATGRPQKASHDPKTE
jgi:hypothetical protein